MKSNNIHSYKNQQKQLSKDQEFVNPSFNRQKKIRKIVNKSKYHKKDFGVIWDFIDHETKLYLVNIIYPYYYHNHSKYNMKTVALNMRNLLSDFFIGEPYIHTKTDYINDKIKRKLKIAELNMRKETGYCYKDLFENKK